MNDSIGVRTWATRFALLGDPSRLTLLLLIRRAGSICVSDLATASGLKPTTVSQALRLLRVNGVVRAHRDGHQMYYELTDHHTRTLLDPVHENTHPSHDLSVPINDDANTLQ